MTLLDPDELPFPFCPGCSHEQIFETLVQALEAGGHDPRRIVVVSDIGCHGIADRLLRVHTFHGLHGRSITYATGIKLARPDLHVVVLMGDGGTGIGGTHLINAARRNVGLTVVVFNNFNYGMTGGQHSVTTPAGAVTATTPEGHIEAGFDLTRLGEACGATFVARATAFDADLADVVGQALAHQGFALVDVWGVCTAWYMRHNDWKKPQLLAAARAGAGLGIRRQAGPAEWSAAQVRRPAPPAPRDLPVHHAATLAQELRLVVAGSAGMRVRRAASIVAHAAVLSGLHAAQKDAFPVTVGRGYSVSELILSPAPIHDLQVTRPDRLVIASEDGRAKTRGHVAHAGRVWVRAPLAVDRADAASVELPGVRPTEVAFALAGRAVRDVLPAAALAEAIALVAPAADRERMLAALDAG